MWDGIGFFTWSLLTSTTVRNGWQCTCILLPRTTSCFPEKVIRHKASNKHRIRIGISPYLKFGPEYLLLTPRPVLVGFFKNVIARESPHKLQFVWRPCGICSSITRKTRVNFEYYAEQFLTEGLNGQLSVVKFKFQI